jgi:hypothetical protein
MQVDVHIGTHTELHQGWDFNVHTKHCCQKTRPGEELEVEVAEDKITFLDALKGLEVTRNYTCLFDTEDNLL